MSYRSYFLYALFFAELFWASFAEGKVLILGGGFAGLQAAQTLKDNGVDFLLLEASDHVGGRAASGAIDEIAADSFYLPRDTKKPGGDPLDPWFKKCQLTWSKPADLDLAMINSTGADLASMMTGRLNEFYAILNEAANDYDRGLIPDSRSPSLEALLTMYGWHPTTLIDWIVEWYFFELDYGLRSQAQSAAHYLFLASPTSGVDRTLQFYYSSNELKPSRKLPKCMSDMIFTGDLQDKLVLNAKVTSIAYTSTGVTVTTESGSTYEGDYAIVTFSLGVLQRGLVDFKPQLPFWKRLAWSEFNMMTSTVLYAVFDAKLSLAKEHYTYVTHDLDNNWIRDMTSTLSHLPEYANKTVFHFYVTGRYAERLIDQPLSKTVEDVTIMFQNMFGKKPSNVYVVPAGKDPLLLGGHPVWPVGTSWEDFDDVRRPVERLFFAGDLCWYYRATRSALISGEETANVVTSCMNGGSCAYRQFAQTASSPPEECPTTSGEPRVGGGAGLLMAVVLCLIVMWHGMEKWP